METRRYVVKLDVIEVVEATEERDRYNQNLVKKGEKTSAEIFKIVIRGDSVHDVVSDAISHLQLGLKKD